jgi:glycosyltransferase involved in cell wall biosynthesis
MRICQVLTGIISVLPQGERRWGAVEKIISEYQTALTSMGHTVDIKYLNEIKKGDYDIVHLHMGNLALEAQKKGLPYIFSLHDHHVEYYGKDSYSYKHNLEAIKGSIFSITHAEHLLPYFDGTDKLFYLSHGVNTSYYKPLFSTSGSDYNKKEFKLLMVANNGLAGDYGIDRKGFRVGIEAAIELNMPITIVGAEANEKFFEIHTELLDYNKLTLDYSNPTEDKLLHYYLENDIFLHPSILEAGHPNLTLLEAASCCLPMVATYNGTKSIFGLFGLDDTNVSGIVHNIKWIKDNYNALRTEMYYAREKYDWKYVCHNLAKSYEVVLKMKNETSEIVAEKYYQSHIKQNHD